MRVSKEVKNSKIPFICDKALLLSNICNKCGSENAKN